MFPSLHTHTYILFFIVFQIQEAISRLMRMPIRIEHIANLCFIGIRQFKVIVNEPNHRLLLLKRQLRWETRAVYSKHHAESI